MQAAADMGLTTYHRQLEASRNFAKSLLDGTQKMELLVMDSTRRNLDKMLDFAEACAAARDPEGVSTLQYTFFGHSPEELLEAQKQMTDIVLQTGVALGGALGQMVPDKNLFIADTGPNLGFAEPQVVDAHTRVVEPWNTWMAGWRQFSEATNHWLGASPARIAAGKKTASGRAKARTRGR